jgi:hypothetical protein
MKGLGVMAFVAALAGCGASIGSVELQKAIASKRDEALKEIAAARGAAEGEVDKSIAAGKKEEAQSRAKTAGDGLAALGKKWGELLAANEKELLGRCGSDSIMIKICQEDAAGAAKAVERAVSEARDALAKRAK